MREITRGKGYMQKFTLLILLCTDKFPAKAYHCDSYSIGVHTTANYDHKSAAIGSHYQRRATKESGI